MPLKYVTLSNLSSNMKLDTITTQANNKIKIVESSMSRKMSLNPKISILIEGQTQKCNRCARARRVALYKKFSSTQPNKCLVSFTKKFVATAVVGFR
jgi:hypothetical protein